MLKYQLNINNIESPDRSFVVRAYKKVNFSTFDENNNEVFVENKFDKQMLYCVVDYEDKISDTCTATVIHSLPQINTNAINSSAESINDVLNQKVMVHESTKTESVFFNVIRDELGEIVEKNFKDLSVDINYAGDGDANNVVTTFTFNIYNAMILSAEIDRFYYFKMNSIQQSVVYNDESNKEIKYDLVLNEDHYFRKFLDPDNVMYIYMVYNVIFANREFTIYAKIPVSVISSNILRMDVDSENIVYYTDNGEIADFIDKEDDNSQYTVKGRISLNYASYDVYCRETPYYHYVLNNGRIQYPLDKFSISVPIPTTFIQIPFSSQNSTNLLMSDLQKNFIEKKKEESINGFVEMEKNVYNPVIHYKDKNGSHYDNVFKLKFNLHFREHRGSDWLVDPESYWNGVYRDENEDTGIDKLYLIDSSSDGIGDITKVELNYCNYFTQYDKLNGRTKTKNFDKQSDLLSCLNFTDDDIKYQKAKLRKSFLRLSFYDSMNPANQNLLHTSTIFFDYNKLFSKLLKYGAYTNNIRDKKENETIVKNGSYSQMQYTDIENGDDKIEFIFPYNGARVNREYEYILEGKFNGNKFITNNDVTLDLNENHLYKDSGTLYRVVKDYKDATLKKEKLTAETDTIDPEDYRLSSQFVAENPHLSNNSSEGYNLYLWAENDGGIPPQDIYMKVEFNHAGYGRVIPFMMPFWDPNKDKGKSGIKTFEEIVDDWNFELDGDGKIPKDKCYGIQKYLKYSYIRFKYCYDPKGNRYVYYLDDEFYNLERKDSHYDDDSIVINLYEAKIV